MSRKRVESGQMDRVISIQLGTVTEQPSGADGPPTYNEIANGRMRAHMDILSAREKMRSGLGQMVEDDTRVFVIWYRDDVTSNSMRIELIREGDLESEYFDIIGVEEIERRYQLALFTRSSAHGN
jgi:SPP1 family predicted phage head-tail adaptor